MSRVTFGLAPQVVLPTPLDQPEHGRDGQQEDGDPAQKSAAEGDAQERHGKAGQGGSKADPVHGRRKRAMLSRKSGVPRAVALTRAPNATPSSKLSSSSSKKRRLVMASAEALVAASAAIRRGRLSLELIVRHHPADQSGSPGLLCTQQSPGEYQVQGDFLTDLAPEKRHHHGGSKPTLDLGISELGASSRDHNVTRGGQPGATRERRPWTRATTGLGNWRRRPSKRPSTSAEASFSCGTPISRSKELVEIGPGTEVLARPAYQYGAHFGVEIGPLELTVHGDLIVRR